MAKDRGIQVIDNQDQGTLLDLKIEVQRNADGKITSGLALGNTLQQNKAFLLIAHPNDFKAIPTLGIGIEDLLLSEELLEYRHKIREQFARDGLTITELDLYSLNKVRIEAHYE